MASSSTRPVRLPKLGSPIRDHRTRVLQALVTVFVLLVAIALVPFVSGGPTHRITAYFATAIGVYPGSDIRVLGVKVGSIDSVEPLGDKVKVDMRVDDDIDVPAGARAVVIAPNLVSDRYIQLDPAYGGGPKMADGASIDVSNTATPLELDQLYAAVRKISGDLGPRGVNAQGALSDVIRVGAANLGGNGQALNTMISDLGKASQTLAGNSGDLYATIANLNKFSEMLRANDGRIRLAENQLAEVSGFLAADRDELGAALRNLALALAEVKGFIQDNRAALKRNVGKLSDVTQVLVDQRASLAELIDTAPLVTQNALSAYDPKTRTLMARGNLLEITKAFGSLDQPGVDPIAADQRPVCAAAASATRTLREQCDRLKRGGLVAVAPNRETGLPALPLPPAGKIYAGTGGKADH
ncbi:virulence factor Mce-like protein [Actinomadura coerulea]|uniref:Virulence factor Mce-like protein n=1 Tax=Actinomadura coerulea TaxID=46159 RepID=A0A7X0G204_9ACTN|nr:MlaD family protein [Actinomadura coerulea]MBB6397240.1 virulence factor Mce-like protein [Actinomadura coerulea]GGQ44169.1 ABC transporter substrate-binding protein [Actinomadura coerulea]